MMAFPTIVKTKQVDRSNDLAERLDQVSQQQRVDQQQIVLSIVIPCYNEERTLALMLGRLIATELDGVGKEIILVDDYSTDSSVSIAERIALETKTSAISVLRQPHNLGKGAAVRRGFDAATGDFVVILDADLEYNPEDFKQMLALFHIPGVDVVFGSRRFLSSNPVSGVVEYFGAQAINFLTNVLYNVRISDQFTCLKMMRHSVLNDLRLFSSGFEFDAELTAKLLRAGHVIQEVPIQYAPRTRADGKKIRWRDGLTWAWLILKYRFTSPAR